MTGKRPPSPTLKQSIVFSWIKKEIITKGFPPTRAEIANHFGLKSSNSAELYLQALHAHGWIKIVKGVSRGIQITKPDNSNPSGTDKHESFLPQAGCGNHDG